MDNKDRELFSLPSYGLNEQARDELFLSCSICPMGSDRVDLNNPKCFCETPATGGHIVYEQAGWYGEYCAPIGFIVTCDKHRSRVLRWIDSKPASLDELRVWVVMVT